MVSPLRLPVTPQPDINPALFPQNFPSLIFAFFLVLFLSISSTHPNKKGEPPYRRFPLIYPFIVPTLKLFYLDFLSSRPSGASNSRNIGFRMPVLQPLEDSSVLKDHVEPDTSSPR